MADKKTIDQLLAEYRNTLVQAKNAGQPLPPPPTLRPPPVKLTPAERLARTGERLRRIQELVARSDIQRMHRLLTEAKLHLDVGNMLAVFSCAAELAHVAKVHAIGLERAHPMLASTVPPPPGTGVTTSMLPAPRSGAPPGEVVDEEGGGGDG